MTFQNNRTSRLLQILKTDKAVSIRILAESLDVSEMTIRRDLKKMAENKEVLILHGAAMLNYPAHDSTDDHNYILTRDALSNIEEKRNIGRMAALLIEKGDSIIIDGGSTTEWLARYLPEDTEITVLCYSLNILLELRKKPKVRISFAGGQFHEDTLIFESPEGVALIERFRANKAFISASGVSQKLGITCNYPHEITVKKAAITSSAERILLADSGKFGRISPNYIADISDIHRIVSGTSIPEEYIGTAKAFSISLTLV